MCYKTPLTQTQMDYLGTLFSLRAERSRTSHTNNPASGIVESCGFGPSAQANSPLRNEAAPGSVVFCTYAGWPSLPKAQSTQEPVPSFCSRPCGKEHTHAGPFFVTALTYSSLPVLVSWCR